MLTGLSGSSKSVFSSENIVSVVENTENIEGVGGIVYYENEVNGQNQRQRGIRERYQEVVCCGCTDDSRDLAND